MMSHIVFLVGAGATLAEALPSHPAFVQTPPLDTTFLKLCRRIGGGDVSTVRNYVRDRYGIDPFAELASMEHLFNMIYSDVFSASGDQNALSAYSALLKVYRRIIARTTNWLSGRGRSGIGALLKHVWERDRPDQITVVTFNQDLLIENALEEMSALDSYSDIPWNLETCYQIPFRGYLYTSQGTFFRSSQERKSVQVLKLHGSLNWFYLARSAVDVRNSIRRPGNDLYCLSNRRIYEGLTYKRNKRSMHLVPLIVPPIYEKSAGYKDLLGGVWRKARTALEAATKLVVFGYSFPASDFAASSLLRSAFHASELAEASVIDVNPETAARVSGMLGSPCHHYFHDIGLFRR